MSLELLPDPSSSELDRAAMHGRRWSDLPADVLREISGRLHAAAGFVYFHAVCKPWRASRDPLSRRTARTQLFLPWLLAPPGKDWTQLRFRCVFSKSSYHVLLPPSSPPPARPARNWLGSSDGAELRYLTAEHLCPTLHDPLTGEFTHLPPFPYNVRRWEVENPQGIIYSDGTAFLYSLCYDGGDAGQNNPSFRAVLLPPGGTRWTVVEKTVGTPWCPVFCAAYHRGKIMFTVEANLWHIITPDGGNEAGDLLLVHRHMSDPDLGHVYSYVVESCGVLLLVSVHVHFHYMRGFNGGMKHVLSMSLHALEEEASTQEKKTRWVKKDGRSVANRVLFLGKPSSFVIDSSRLGGSNGGCAYFVYYNSEVSTHQKLGVYRCNLISNEVEFVEELPQGWNDGMHTWHVPQPAVAPIQELMGRKLKQTGTEQTAALPASPTHTIQNVRNEEPCFQSDGM